MPRSGVRFLRASAVIATPFTPDSVYIIVPPRVLLYLCYNYRRFRGTMHGPTTGFLSWDRTWFPGGDDTTHRRTVAHPGGDFHLQKAICVDTLSGAC